MAWTPPREGEGSIMVAQAGHGANKRKTKSKATYYHRADQLNIQTYRVLSLHEVPPPSDALILGTAPSSYNTSQNLRRTYGKMNLGLPGCFISGLPLPKRQKYPFSSRFFMVQNFFYFIFVG